MCISGTSVIQVTATDADDGMYGNSAKLVYSISQGHPYFSVDPNTGTFQSPPSSLLRRFVLWCPGRTVLYNTEKLKNNPRNHSALPGTSDVSGSSAF